METKKEYIAPMITLTSYATEEGYAASLLSLVQALSGFNASGIQEWNTESITTTTDGGDWGEWN